MKDYFKKHWKSLIIKFVVIALVLVTDLLTKAYFATTDGTIPFIKGFISFHYLENTGAAFGLFGNSTVMLTIFSVVFVVVFTIWDIMNKDKSIWADLGYAFVVAGAIGNMIDRICFGYVRDFINFDFMTFGVFNIADAFITIGCVCYIIYLIVYAVRAKRTKK